MKNILQIHQEALDIYRAHREKNPGFTFAVRMLDAKDRKVSDGHFFQGGADYVWTSPYQPNSDNMTKRIGFCVGKGECKISIILADIKKYPEKKPQDVPYLPFYEEVIKSLKEELGTGVPKNRGGEWTLDIATKWQDHLRGFLENIVPRINQIAKEMGVPDDYLYVPPAKFEKYFKLAQDAETKLKSDNAPEQSASPVRQTRQPNGRTTKAPLNQILYGPPGTGKTYSTVEKALKILGGADDSIKSIAALKKEFKDQVEFVTFHQNFSYEDFIEGIKPSTAGGAVSYDVEDGIFKLICDRAANAAKATTVEVDVEQLINDYAEHVMSYVQEGKTVTLYTKGKSTATLADVTWQQNVFRSFLTGGSIKGQRLSKKVIMRDYQNFLDDQIKTRKDIEPTYESKSSYHGNARPYFELYKRLKEFQDTKKGGYDARKSDAPTTSHEHKKYVLIIDEINRGNIAKIFGELITLLEESKRAGNGEAISVTLPYSKEPFTVPNNLYIIGTMNTSDRSIARLDTALRRRFKFFEKIPDITKATKDVEGVNCQELLKAINERLTVLLDREHQIGHSYFMKLATLQDLKKCFQRNVIPLLQEYFYEQWEKIDAVLNGNGFATKKRVGENAFKERHDFLPDDPKIYNIALDGDNVWDKPDSYIKIYKTAKQTDSAEDSETDAEDSGDS